MRTYILRRLLVLVPLLFFISLISFTLLSLSPGDYLTTLKNNRDISPQFIEKLKKEYGLDRNVPEQYIRWLNKAIRLDFGYSFNYKIPVTQLIAQRIPATLLLAVSSLLLTYFIAIPLGILSAIYKDSWFDRLASGFSFLALSIPEMSLALVAIYFAATTGWFPMGGIYSIDFEFLSPLAKVTDILHHLFLPTLVLALGSIAGIMRIMRANFLDEIRAVYVTTARAKGMPEGWIMFRHVFRNAINPLITMAGYAIAGLLSGSLLVENIMSYPGLGQMTLEAFFQEDIYVVMASILMASIMLVFGNLLSDLLLALTDPRIRLSK